jgi:methylmalonyl-CoA mutase
MEELAAKSDLFSTFKTTSYQDWLKAASAEIDGKNPVEALQWKIGEVNGYPFYTQEDLKQLTTPSPVSLQPSTEEFKGSRCWHNTPCIKVLEEAQANKLALRQLQQGADGILFDLHRSSTISLEKLLESIEWPWCIVAFQSMDYNESFLHKLDQFSEKKNFRKHELQGFYLSETYPQHPQVLHNIIHNLEAYKNFRLLGVRSPHEDVVNHISDLLTQSVALIDQLTNAGSGIETIIRNVFFSVTPGPDFFLEIARLKALRHVWYQVVKAYGVPDYSPANLFIHAHSTAWSNPAFEPHENMLKSTTASMAAILGGCNALTIEPALEQNDRLSRIALNVSHILREESHLNKVADPTAGSYYVENLVHQVAQQAWAKFKQNVSKA